MVHSICVVCVRCDGDVRRPQSFLSWLAASATDDLLTCDDDDFTAANVG